MIKLGILLGLLLSSLSYSGPIEIDQFPDADKVYQAGHDTGFAQYLTRSAYGTKKIALTFDDGPHPTRTPELLNTLKKYNIQATFFVLSEKITPNTEYIIEQMLIDGHYVASHHHTHKNSNQQTEKEWRDYLSKSISKIEEIETRLGINQNQMFYRFPYGAYGKANTYHHLNVMKEVSNKYYGINCINFAFWDIDTDDWLVNMTSENIRDNIVAQANGGQAYRHKYVNGKYVKEAYTVTRPLGGGVVLMHDIHQRSIEAAELFLENIDSYNLEVVPLDSFKEFSYGDLVCNLLN